MIKKMKSLDILSIVCVVFLVALVLLGKDTAPVYLFVIELLLIVVMLVTLILNLKYKTKIQNNTVGVIKSISVEDYEGIKEKINENFGGYISEEIETLLEEVVSKNENMKHVFNLAKYIEKDELNKFNIREIEMDSQLRYALRVFIKQKETLDSSQTINTEFLKRIKSNKFGEINIDDDNVTEQQLNAILKSFEVIDKNLKSTQPAFYEGDFNVEIETVDVERDYLNITSKLGTLLTSQKKSIINLYYAILMLEEFDHQEIISSSYKGNLVHNFRALETVYENLTVSIENIAFAIEHKVNISYDNVSEIFRPIIDTINKDESFKNEVPEQLETIVNDKAELILESEFDEKLLNAKSNFESKHFTKNHELILDIENRLKDMQIVLDEDLINETDLEEVLEESLEETKEDVAEDVKEDVKEDATEDVIEEAVEDVTKDVIEEIDIVIDINLENEVDVNNETTLEVKDVDASWENSNELDVNNQDENDENLITEFDNSNDVSKGKEQSSIANVNNNKVTEVKTKPLQTFQTKEDFKRDNQYRVQETNVAKFSDTKNDFKSKITKPSQQTQLNNTSSRLNENKGGKRVSSINNSKNNTKKPVTYQEAVKSGEIDKFKSDNNVRKRIEPIKNRSEKEPITYQQFLKDKGTTTSSTDASRRNAVPEPAKRPAETKATPSKFTSARNTTKEFDSNKKRNKLAENLGRELSQRERAELDLYGEILDDKTRAKMDLITSGTDLAGF